MNERFLACFSAREWDAFAAILAEDITTEDRRRVVNAGVRRDRDAEIKDFRSAADLGVTHATSNTIATRGERLALTRCRYSHSDGDSAAFSAELLGIVEINADYRIEAWVTFDLEDFDAAIAELDARYLAGEAAAHAQTWSVITGGHAAVSRCELPPTTPDCESIDHRRGTAFAPGELVAYFRAGWDAGQEIRTYVEIVHRLSDLGAVCTHAGHGISHDGFDAEWRGSTLTIEGDLVNRCEVFDEADLEAAITRFDELHPQTRRLENTASRVAGRNEEHFTARNWDAMTEMLANDFSSDDRRRVVNAGVRRGRDAAVQDAHANADLGATDITSTVIATRGEHLVLHSAQYSSSTQRPEAFHVDVLNIYEIDADARIAASVTFDPDDFDAAIDELDARYLAGEAAAHAQTWSAVLRPYTAINRQELFATTPDWVNVDHRRGATFAPGDANAYVRASLDDGAGSIYVETVHRLGDLGAVVTWAATGTTQEGFDAEWRGIHVLTVDGDLISRFEVFDEADLQAALARFDELQPPTRRLENAASRAIERYSEHFAARDWDALAQILAADISVDDRRRVVSAGIRHGRDADIATLGDCRRDSRT